MVESAAGLVDHVFPQVPIRQWVLSFPWPLRLLFAARPQLLTRVLAVVIRALSDTASETAPDDFAANLDRVCENSFRLLERLVPEIAAGPGSAESSFQQAS